MKVCLECGSIFNRLSELKEGTVCPTLYCNGYVLEIDDSIVHTILLLNQKGYITNYSCSGHTWGNDPFIVFDDFVHPEAFLTLPNGFSLSANYGKIRIIKSIPQKSPAKRQEALMKASVDLIAWADKLQPGQFMEANFFINNQINEDEFIEEVGQILHLDLVQIDEIDINSKWIVFDKLIDPLSFEKLTKEIKEFANKKGVEVNTEIYE